MGGREEDERNLDRYRSQYRELGQRFQNIGFIWQGSVQVRWLTCGRPACPCATNPRARHGPYVYWTTKEKGKSVAKLLHGSQREILTEWVGNRQKLEAILVEMGRISRKAYKVALREREREKKT